MCSKTFFLNSNRLIKEISGFMEVEKVPKETRVATS